MSGKPRPQPFNVTVMQLKSDIEEQSNRANALLAEAAKLPENQQTNLLATAGDALDAAETMIAVLKKVGARETAARDKVASRVAESANLTRMVPLRSAAKV